MGLPGSQRNVQRLVDEHYVVLYRYAYRLSGSATDAEDLTQETYCKAQSSLSQLRDPARAKAWLFRILRNVYLHKLRAAQTQHCVSLDDMSDFPERLPEPLPAVEPEQLQEALSDLPEVFRTPIILYYFEDFSYRDIAEQMDLPLGTVMSRLARAKAYLRSRLLQPDAEALIPGRRGRPMDCRTARLLLDFARPGSGDLEAREAEALESHLAECTECGALARGERLADARLASAMRGVPVPQDLRARLHARLAAERMTWYRRRVRDFAAAAAVLLVTWVAAQYWLSHHRPPVDVDVVLEETNELRGASAEQIERWFYKNYRTKIVAPRNFDFAFLFSCAQQDFKGQLVPRLLFVRGQNCAEVLVLSRAQFDLESSLSRPRAESGGLTVEIRPHPMDPDIAYLIEYTGGSLEWFLVQGQTQIS